MSTASVQRRIETISPIKVTQGDDDGDGEDEDDEASSTENNAMDWVERGGEDYDVGLNERNADEEAPDTHVLPERRQPKLHYPSKTHMSSEYVFRFGGGPKYISRFGGSPR
jgi:hypothetical protein